MAVIATYNIKGGVGKTATAVNIAWLAARDGMRTLLWDLDPQGAATFYFRVKPKVKGGVEKLVRKRSRFADRIRGSDYPGLDILPADFSYRNMDLVLEDVKGSRERIARLLEPLRDDYDVILVDCAPSISLVSENVFRASDALLVPVVPTTLSLRTYEQLRRHLAETIESPPRLFAFFSMVDRRRSLHREIVEHWQAKDAEMMGAVIPYASAVEQMGLRRAPLGAWAAGDRAALAFAILWAEVRVRLFAESTAR